MEIQVAQPAVACWPVVEEIARLWNPVSNQDGVFVVDFLDVADSGMGFTARAVGGWAGRARHAVTVTDAYQMDEAREHQPRRLLRLALYRLLRQQAGGGSPWGILTGVRPLKVLRRLFDSGKDQNQARQTLLDRYDLDPAKADLLLACLPQQQAYWRLAPFRGTVGVYVGIPFCPSRCSYCSFAGIDIHRHPEWVAPYLEALTAEIIEAGQALRQVGWQADSLYVGGGTPTAITPGRMRKLLEILRRELPLLATAELTVEAGRPDTLTGEMWQVLAAAGVNRVSVNPQTKHQQTLDRVGRSHRADQVAEQVAKGKALGMWVNMDLIAGLPGEGSEEFASSLDWAMDLRPENLTVHTLSLKRGSILRQQAGDSLASTGIAEMLACRDQLLPPEGYQPYYLYRQKNTLGLMENVGYCRGDTASRYNMAVMDERQVILGLGAGAGSKWVRPDGTLEATYNPKDILCYIQRGNGKQWNKIDKLSQLIYNSWK